MCAYCVCVCVCVCICARVYAYLHGYMKKCKKCVSVNQKEDVLVNEKRASALPCRAYLD
jgi:hypothetical protein